MPLSDDVAGALLEAWVEDEVNLPDTFELVFRDPMRTVLASGGFEIGKKLTIDVVSEATAGGVAIFDGEITAVEAEIEREQTLTIVRGYDMTHRLQRGTTTETHLDVTYGDIAGKDRRPPRADQGRRRAQHGRPRGGRAVEPDRLGVPRPRSPPSPATRSSSSTARCTSASRVTPARRRRRATSSRTTAPARVRRQPAAPAGDGQRRRAGRGGQGPRVGLQDQGGGRGLRRAPATGRAAPQPGRGAADLASKLGGGTLVKVDLPVNERRGRPGGRRVARRAARQRGDRARRRRLRQPRSARRRVRQRRRRRRAVRRPLRADVVPPHVRPDERVPDGVPRQRAAEPHDARARQRRRRQAIGRTLSGVVPGSSATSTTPTSSAG